MSTEVINTTVNKIETTLGELIEAVTQIAAEHTSSEQEKYLLATQAVEEILNTQK